MGKRANINPTTNMWTRRQGVEKCLRRGITDQVALARRFGVTQKTISYDIEAIVDSWQADLPATWEARTQRRIKQLEEIITEAWNDYERSKQSQREVSKIIRPCFKCHGVEPDEGQPKCKSCGGEGKIVDITRKTKEQVGDPAYMALIKECVKECSRLEGLYQQYKEQRGARVTIRGNVLLPGAVTNNNETTNIVNAFANTPTDLLLAAKQAVMTALQAQSQQAIESRFVSRDKPKEAE